MQRNTRRGIFFCSYAETNTNANSFKKISILEKKRARKSLEGTEASEDET